MATETIFQNYIFSEFIIPFLLIFTIIFAILEKTKVLGDAKTQVNAIVSFVVGLIFVSVAYPKDVVSNMILFLTVAIVVAFVAMMLWGFVSGGESKLLTGDGRNWVTWTIGGIIALAVLIATVWATDLKMGVFEKLFTQSWSNAFWTNLVFIIVIAVALAVVIKGGSSGGSSGGDKKKDS